MARLTPLLFLLWVGVTVSTVVDLQKRIYGGQPCGPTERLYHVQIQDENNNFKCGGSLISDRWILTAAHCWDENLKVSLSVHPGPGTVETIKESVMYTDKDQRIHDIMLLKLPGPTSIKPVPLPDCKNVPRKGDSVQIAGQGATTAGPNGEKVCGYSPTLQCADTTVVACSDQWYMRTLCAKKAGVDTCPGDSGGGVVYKGKIYGVHICGGEHVCATESEFKDVCQYMDWINNTIKSTSTKIGDNIKARSNIG